MNPKIKAVLFDLDGTIIDSIPLHKKSFLDLFARFGCKLPESSVAKYIRWSTDDIYHRLKVRERLGLDLEKFQEFRRSVYYSLIKGKKLVFAERVALVKSLKKRFLVGLVTNSSGQTTHRSTPREVLGLFDTIVTYSDVVRGKPDPEMLLLAAKKLGVSAGECVVVGDSVVDVFAARKANMRVLAFFHKTAASSLAELKKVRPTKIVRSAKQIARFLAPEKNL